MWTTAKKVVVRTTIPSRPCLPGASFVAPPSRFYGLPNWNDLLEPLKIELTKRVPRHATLLDSAQY